MAGREVVKAESFSHSVRSPTGSHSVIQPGVQPEVTQSFSPESGVRTTERVSDSSSFRVHTSPFQTLDTELRTE
jgi:hypothetical protein